MCEPVTMSLLAIGSTMASAGGAAAGAIGTGIGALGSAAAGTAGALGSAASTTAGLLGQGAGLAKGLMLNPLAQGASTLLSGVMGLQQQSAMNQVAEQQAAAARANTISMYKQLQERRRQMNVAAQMDASERTRQAMRERARLRVGFAESGLAGATPARLFGQTQMQRGLDLGVLETNRENRMMQSMAEGQNIRASGVSGVSKAMSQYTPINPFMSGLQIGAQTLQSGAQGYMLKSALSQQRKGV